MYQKNAFFALVFTLRSKVNLILTRAIGPITAQSAQFSKIVKKMNIDSCQFFSHWKEALLLLKSWNKIWESPYSCLRQSCRKCAPHAFFPISERGLGRVSKWHVCGSSGRKNVLRKLLCIPYHRLKASFSVCWLCSTVCLFVTERVLTKTAAWNVQAVNVCFSKSLFTFVWLSFFVTWKLLGLGTTNVKGKTDHPVSLRWNKEFWTFPKRRVFFWLFIRFICELISPSFAGLN